MSSLAYNKAKGRDAEVAVAEHAKARGFCLAHRKARTGAKDEGDVWLNELASAVEVKATKACDVAGFLAEARTEADNAGCPIEVAVWKRPRQPVDKWAAFLSFDSLLDLLERAQHPSDTDLLWRSLWERATDDVVTLVEFIRANGLGPPYVSTLKAPEVVGA